MYKNDPLTFWLQRWLMSIQFKPIRAYIKLNLTEKQLKQIMATKHNRREWILKVEKKLAIDTTFYYLDK